jgi:hypothetical protein
MYPPVQERFLFLRGTVASVCCAWQAHAQLLCIVPISRRNAALTVVTAAGVVGPLCPAGKYLNNSTGGCISCAAGRWSATGQTGPCLQLCTAGYACAVGSSSPTASVCPAGQYSDEGAGACTRCAAGRWSDAVARTFPCEENCTAGYACPPGSEVASAVECPPGQFSLTGSGACTGCEAGRWSGAAARWYPCDQLCSEGYRCPEGSIRGDWFPNICPVGTYSKSGASECIP